MALPPLLGSVVGFLRAGYPEGIPVRDYIPLFALLARQLSSQEVVQVADALIASGDPATGTAVREAISAVTHQPTLEQDIVRVSAHLAAGGWPLAWPRDNDPSEGTPTDP